MRWTEALILAGATAICGASDAWSKPIDETVALAANGTVRVSNVSGTVRIVGSKGTNVHVTGTAGEKVKDVVVEASGGGVTIEVVLPKTIRGGGGDADLIVEVPKGANVEVETVSANVDVEAVQGIVEVETVSGNVDMRGPASSLEATTVSGSIDVTGRVDGVEAESVSGAITLVDVVGTVEAETTSGSIEVDADDLSKVECTSVSGRMRFEGRPAKGAEILLENFSGSVDVVLGPSPDASIEMETFSGHIDSEFGGKVERPEFGPGASLAEELGNGSARVSISTFSGSAELRKKGGAAKDRKGKD